MWLVRDVADHRGPENQVAVSREVFDPVSPMVKKAAVDLVMTAEMVRVGRAAMAPHRVVIATKPFGRVNPAHHEKSPRKDLSFQRFQRTLPLTS